MSTRSVASSSLDTSKRTATRKFVSRSGLDGATRSLKVVPNSSTGADIKPKVPMATSSMKILPSSVVSKSIKTTSSNTVAYVGAKPPTSSRVAAASRRPHTSMALNSNGAKSKAFGASNTAVGRQKTAGGHPAEEDAIIVKNADLDREEELDFKFDV
ncbi:hypothetical protein BDZ97DRAFT_552335 [Flammula alnicola]|nr:hypothetical protein BDZ97DRAFT_552335 [Flammula alnicola]